MRILFILFFIVFFKSINAQRSEIEVEIQLGHTDFITHTAFSPDNKYLVSGGLDKRIIIWDIQTGLQLKAFFIEHDLVKICSINNTGLCFLVSNGDVFQINISSLSLKLVGNFGSENTINGDIKDFSISEDDDYIGFSHSKIKEYGFQLIELRKEKKHFLLPNFISNSHQFAPNKQFVVCGSSRFAEISVLNLKDFSEVFRIKLSDKLYSEIKSITISPDSKFVVVTHDKKLIAYETHTWKQVWDNNLEFGNQSNAIFDPQKNILIARSGKIYTKWDLNTQTKIDSFIGNSTDLISISPDGKTISMGDGFDQAIKLINTKDGNTNHVLKTKLKSLNCAAFNSEGNGIFYSHKSKGLKLLNLSTGKVNIWHQFHNEQIKHIYSITRYSVLSFGADHSNSFEIILTYLDKNAQLSYFKLIDSIRVIGAGILMSDDKKSFLITNGSTCHFFRIKANSIENPYNIDLLKLKKGASFEIDYLNENELIVSYDGVYNKIKLLEKHYETENYIQKNYENEWFNVYNPKKGQRVFMYLGHVLGFYGPYENRAKYNLYVSDSTKKEYFLDSLKREIDYTFLSKSGNYLGCIYRTEGYFSSRMICVYDLSNKKKLWQQILPSSEIENLDFSANEKYVIVRIKEGIISYLEAETGTFIASIFLGDDNEFLIYNKDNYYLLSKEAKGFVGFRIDNSIYPFEQFDLIYNRPDTVIESLGYASQFQKQLYKQAYLKRLKRAGIKEQDLHKDKIDLPKVFIDEETLDRGSDKGKTKSIRVSFLGNKVNLKGYKVWVNGVLVEDEKLNGSVTEQDQILDILQNYGRNKVQISVYNELGYESNKEVLELNYLPSYKPKRNLYMVVIGVENYQDKTMNLKYAIKDANDLINTFKGSAITTEFEKIIPIQLFNSDFTLPNLKIVKEKLKLSGVDDVVMVSYSGHGLLDTSNNYYLGQTNTDFKNPINNSMPYDSLEWLLNKIPARQKLLLVDACHSGEVDDDQTLHNTALENTKGGKTINNYKKNSDLTLAKSFDIMQELFSDLSSNSGTQVISASAGNSFALESDKWENGLFTFCLIKGLTDKSSDKNRDRELSISELRNYVSEQVFNLSDGHQKPTARKVNLDYDWRLISFK